MGQDLGQDMGQDRGQDAGQDAGHAGDGGYGHSLFRWIPNMTARSLGCR